MKPTLPPKELPKRGKKNFHCKEDGRVQKDLVPKGRKLLMIPALPVEVDHPIVKAHALAVASVGDAEEGGASTRRHRRRRSKPMKSGLQGGKKKKASLESH